MDSLKYKAKLDYMPPSLPKNENREVDQNSFNSTAPYMPLQDQQFGVNTRDILSYPTLQPPTIFEQRYRPQIVPEHIPVQLLPEEKDFEKEAMAGKRKLVHILKAMRVVFILKALAILGLSIFIFSGPSKGPGGFSAVILLSSALIMFGANIRLGRKILRKSKSKFINKRFRHIIINYCCYWLMLVLAIFMTIHLIYSISHMSPPFSPQNGSLNASTPPHGQHLPSKSIHISYEQNPVSHSQQPFERDLNLSKIEAQSQMIGPLIENETVMDITKSVNILKNKEKFEKYENDLYIAREIYDENLSSRRVPDFNQTPSVGSDESSIPEEDISVKLDINLFEESDFKKTQNQLDWEEAYLKLRESKSQLTEYDQKPKHLGRRKDNHHERVKHHGKSKHHGKHLRKNKHSEHHKSHHHNKSDQAFDAEEAIGDFIFVMAFVILGDIIMISMYISRLSYFRIVLKRLEEAGKSLKKDKKFKKRCRKQKKAKKSRRIRVEEHKSEPVDYSLPEPSPELNPGSQSCDIDVSTDTEACLVKKLEAPVESIQTVPSQSIQTKPAQHIVKAQLIQSASRPQQQIQGYPSVIQYNGTTYKLMKMSNLQRFRQQPTFYTLKR